MRVPVVAGILICLCSLLPSTSAQGCDVKVDLDENRETGYQVYSFPQPTSNEIYSFYPAQDSDSKAALKQFKISERGVVTTTTPIEYKIGKPNRYNLIVLLLLRGAKEGGKPSSLCITIKDTNNFSPTFPANEYHGRVMENSGPDVVVKGLENCFAEDRDTSGISSYSIGSGNEEGYFQTQMKVIGNRAFLILLTTNKKIVRNDDTPEITLTVRASDRARYGTTKIVVEILDANNHEPKFEVAEYSATISEDTPLLTSVLRVRATDEDSGTNGGIYYLISNPSPYFSVDAITGVIKVVSQLSSNPGKVTFTVTAQDRGVERKSSSVVVTISITDIPSYPPPDTVNPGINTRPTFTETSYSANVREDFPVGAALLVIHAVDRDPPGDNRRLQYALLGGSTFKIDSVSGVVTLNNALNFEGPTKQYRLIVTATDKGRPVQSAQTDLNITVQDVDENRNAPNFQTQDEQQASVVTENSNPGAQLVPLSPIARDSDQGQDGQVAYSILSGSGLAYFKINENTGAVTTNAPLDREKQKQYDLIIQARDKAVYPLYSHLYLMITVRDEDDNYPDFSQPVYQAKVPEKAPQGTFVTVIHAVDKDGQTVQYSVSDHKNLFDIQPSTGLITTKQGLDPTLNQKSYILSVVAAADLRQSEAQVMVTVVSESDSPPTFLKSQYKATVPENLEQIESLFCLAASDAHGNAVKYSVLDSNNGLFDVDDDSGRFSVTSSLDYEVTNDYTLGVQASSGTRQTAVANVEIDVEEVRDPPRFAKSVYKFIVSENAQVGTSVRGTDNADGSSDGLAIIDDDTDKSQFDCSMDNFQSSDVIDYLIVRNDKGECVLVTQSPFDFSDTPKFAFEVRATDKNYRNMYASAQVELVIQDTNNHAPEFTQTSYWTSVGEDSPVGSTILKISAHDKDAGSFGEITYQLLVTQDQNRFSLDSNSGVLTSALSLSPKKYQLQVQASDLASANRKTTVVDVFVSVYSKGTAYIQFDPASYSSTVDENSPQNTQIFTVVAKGPSGSIVYSIVGGNDDGAFKIDGSGKVSSAGSLNREVQDAYNLVVRAETASSSLAAEVITTIKLSDQNDERPRIIFDKTPKELAIEDFSPQGSFVVKVYAVDRDIGNAGKITYSMVTTGTPFEIDNNNGEIRASREIKRQEKQLWDIKVLATDGGGFKSAETALKIHVTEGTQAPQIPDRFDVPLDENEGVGSPVKDIVATKVNNYKFRILSGNKDEAFCVDHTGLISVAKPLDREETSSYDLVVSVTAANKVKNTTVVVTLRDKNDDAPTFTKPVYTFDARENLSSGTVIGKVSARDKDSGQNGDVTYTMQYAVDANSKFSVGSKSGDISLGDSLDFESSQQQVLYVKASDRGNPSLSSIVKVVIDVRDENDVDPRFSADSYVAKVALDAAIDSQVKLVSATDLDSGDYGIVVYNITKGNEEDAFKINQNTGVIKLQKSLTTVSADKFRLTVVAKDKGKPPRTGECTVQLNVFLPDGPPKFVVKPVVEEVTEGVAAGERVLVVKAATSEALIYEIVGGNEDGLFKIVPSTGEIRVTRELDYEEAREHHLCVRVMDTRDRSDQVDVVIKVKNINDNSPRFPGDVGGFVERKVEDDFQVGDSAARLSAFDGDAGDIITYTLSSNANLYFSMDKNGFLIAKRPRKDISSPFNFELIAKDNGSPQRETKVQVQLVFVSLRPDQQPVREFVKEDQEVGSVVAIVPRYFPGGELSIVFPQSVNFSVTNSGELRMDAPLDFEDKQFYILTVREKEPSPDSRTNDVDVIINVEDINDNKPFMTTSDFFGRVNTNSRPGTSAFHLKAEDNDGGLNGDVVIQLLSRGSPFAFNPIDNHLEVGASLEDKGGYNVTLVVCDRGIPQLCGDPESLDIKTVKFPPQFSESSFKFDVFEDALPGELVGVVNASSVSNARLKFTIEQGDPEQKFTILPSGELKVNSLLDLERQQVYNLKVRASEQIPNGYDGEVDVQVTVMNANEFYPYFLPWFYSKHVPEDVGAGASVLKLEAFDSDCPRRDSCHLVYSLEGTSFFRVDGTSGVISVGGTPLDYEKQRTHVFIAAVKDAGRKKTFTTRAYVKIVLDNINDNKPTFQLRGSGYNIGIAEDAIVNEALAAILARDADGSKVTYQITSGNTQIFQINRDTGVLSLKQSVKGQSATQYTLTVRATDDGRLYNEIKVVLNIEDSNDNRPVFTNCPAQVKVKENLKSGEKVVQVSAEDTKDRGRNKEIEYKLDQSGIDFFEIDNTTAVITTLTSLDREAASTHTLIVQAEDGGHGRDVAERILSYCVIDVVVEDRNDNYPVFLTRGYYGSVRHSTPSDISIVTVSASDADTAPNDEVKYEFTSNPDDLFQIEEDTGTIRTKRSLANFKGTIQLNVKATNKKPMEDATAPARADSKTTVVQIQVTDQQPPKCNQPAYKVSVREDAPVGKSILTIKATGASSEMSYSLVKSNADSEQKFKIDPTSGDISTASTLDYEEKKEYKLYFRAKEKNSDLYTTCYVIVELTDVNDDSPTFKLEGYNARVPENANPNFDVIQVKADDRDKDGNDKVTYELDKSSSVSTDYQFFNIDPNTGTITTTKGFDRETVDKYTINVIAKDQGDPVQSSKVGVTVDVVDENDEAPEFAKRSYTASVDEDAAEGTTILRLTASDADIGDNARLDYFVSSGNTLQNFRMETVYGDGNYGELVLDGKLDFENQEKYQINVTATDRRDSDTVTVYITVRDTNDNVPEFRELVYKARLAEDSAFGVSVEKVTATDKDSPNIQSPLTYSILGSGQKYFKIDKNTALITTANSKLDRETEPVVSFFVKACDGKHCGKALVIVNLIDINDNTPYFPSPPYVGYVEENKDPGASVMVLQALDDDEGTNAAIGYSLEDDAGGRFKIDPDTALVTTLQTLEKEQTPNEFVIRVKATDKGNPRKSDSETAKIIVTDGNDQSPKFHPTVYRAVVPEDAPPGYIVTTVSATDDDEGPNAELEFTIVEGNDPYKFYIDPHTGRIHVSGVLDFDKEEKSFNLTVMVTDRGMPPRPADKPAFVYINLVDSNDNAPVFVPDEYMERVSESHPVGDVVLPVAAVDFDSGTNALFNFTIIDGDIADIFAIRPRSDNKSIGEITTLLPLDRESVSQYNLTIAATDAGGLQGTATVILVLADVNDNGPWFIPPYYEGTIQAGVSTRQSVTILKAFDPDESSNGLPFRFSIENDTDRFVLEKEQDPDSSAYMYSQGTFDRTNRAEWILHVKAEDSGSPRRPNFTNVYVEVLDDRNIHEPFDGTLSIIVNAYNGKFKGGVIGKAYYKDDDYEGDENTYTMASQEYFTVSERTGKIRAEAGIPMGGYSFNIQIVERKSRQGSSFPKTVVGRVNVVVRSVTEAAVQSSVAVQIFGLRKVSHFVGAYYDSFLTLFAGILSGGNTQSVLIFSIQKAPERRIPVGALFGVEIHLAVQLSGNAFMERMDIVRTLLNAKLEMEALGLAIGDIGIDECAYEFQDVGKCRNEITASSAFSVVSGDYGRVPALDSSLTIVSMNVTLIGVYTSIIPKDRNCSTDNPCLHGGTCHNVVPKGIVCECGREYRGPECQSTTRTFKGDTYIWLEKLEAYQRSHVSLQFITETANGLLLFQGPLYDGANNGLPDFMALLMVNGYVQLVITLGAHPSAPLVLYMNRGIELNDKKWHTVEVIRKLKTVVLRIDKCANSEIVEDSGRVIENRENCEIEGEIWGSSIYLNGFGPLQIGGVENEPKNLGISYTGFRGCIRNIYDNGIMYDLINPLKNVGTELGCKLQNNACPDCSNRGYCEPLWVDSICVCDLGYTGPNCNSRSNANYYLANSFTQYQVRQARRKRRELVPPPVSMANEFYTNIALQVKVSPLSSNVVIFLASNSLGTEFSQIDVKNHVLRYVYRLGDRMKILSIPQINITDNEYHAVIVKREGNRASLQIDYEGKVEGNTGGVHKLLNMGGGSFFTGGLPNVTEVRVVQAFVNSGGNAILRTAEGQVISSGMAQGASSFFGGAQFVGSVITIGHNGGVYEQYSSSRYEVLSTSSIRSIIYRTGSRDQILISGSTGAASYSALGSAITIRGSGGVVLVGGGTGGGAGSASGGASGGAGGSSEGTGGSSGGTGGSSGGTGGSSGGTGGSSGGTGGSSGGTGSSSGGAGDASGGAGSVEGGSGTIFGNTFASGGATSELRVYGEGMGWTLQGANEASEAQEVEVIGDFGGCTAANSYNGVDLDSDPSIEARRQNVVFGCPCETGFCLHGGTCVNAVPPFCLCPPGWTGPRCEVVVANPAPGQSPGTRWANPAVVATIAVILLAILFIIGAVLLKRRREPVVVAVVEDGHVHDNVRPYHDEGAGEEDNFGYDISQLMKYTYVENGGLGVAGAGAAGIGGVGDGKFKRGGGAGEEEVAVAENKPLLHGAMPGIGMQHGVTTMTKRRVLHPESIDVKQFIDTRVHEADGEYILSIDELHIYRYEGDDSDVDDLSELGDSDEESDEEEEQEFEFLQSWGKKFDNLNRIFNAED